MCSAQYRLTGENKMSNRPCLHCTKRYPACQDTCPDKAAVDAQNQKIKEAREKFMCPDEKQYRKDKYEKISRRNKYGKQ